MCVICWSHSILFGSDILNPWRSSWFSNVWWTLILARYLGLSWSFTWVKSDQYTVVIARLWKLKILSLFPLRLPFLCDCSIVSFPRLGRYRWQGSSRLITFWYLSLSKRKNPFTKYLLVAQNKNFLIGTLQLIVEKFIFRYMSLVCVCVCRQNKEFLFLPRTV